MARTVRLQLQHTRVPNSNPYLPEVEAALTELEATAGLKERGWDTADAPGVIRHETGPEIIALAAALVELTAALIHLVVVTRRHHPETTINVTVSDPADLKRVLRALGTADAKT